MEAAASPSSPPQALGTAAFRVLEITAYLPLGLALHPGSLVAMKGFSTLPGGFRHGTLQKMGPVTPGGGLMLLPGFVQHPAQLSWGLGDTSEHYPLTVALLGGSQHAPGIPITAPLPVFCRGGLARSAWRGAGRCAGMLESHLQHRMLPCKHQRNPAGISSSKSSQVGRKPLPLLYL